jgi:hypothetical protein
MVNKGEWRAQAAVEAGAARCAEARSGLVEAPSGVVAWQSPNGHVMVSWNDHDRANHK